MALTMVLSLCLSIISCKSDDDVAYDDESIVGYYSSYDINGVYDGSESITLKKNGEGDWISPRYKGMNKKDPTLIMREFHYSYKNRILTINFDDGVTESYEIKYKTDNLLDFTKVGEFKYNLYRFVKNGHKIYDLSRKDITNRQWNYKYNYTEWALLVLYDDGTGKELIKKGEGAINDDEWQDITFTYKKYFVDKPYPIEGKLVIRNKGISRTITITGGEYYNIVYFNGEGTSPSYHWGDDSDDGIIDIYDTAIYGNWKSMRVKGDYDTTHELELIPDDNHGFWTTPEGVRGFKYSLKNNKLTMYFTKYGEAPYTETYDVELLTNLSLNIVKEGSTSEYARYRFSRQ